MGDWGYYIISYHVNSIAMALGIAYIDWPWVETITYIPYAQRAQ